MAELAVEAVGDAAEAEVNRTAARGAERAARNRKPPVSGRGRARPAPRAKAKNERAQAEAERTVTRIANRENRERAAAFRASERQRVTAEKQRAATRQRRQKQVGNAFRGAGQAATVPGDRSYQPVILAEFMVAVLVVALVPLASGGQGNTAGNASASPYKVGDLTQFVAIGVTYFILALFSSGSHGRIAAWFGGIVLLGLGLNVTRTGGLAKVFAIFGNGGGTGGSSAGLPPGTQGPPGVSVF